MIGAWKAGLYTWFSQLGTQVSDTDHDSKLDDAKTLLESVVLLEKVAAEERPRPAS